MNIACHEYDAYLIENAFGVVHNLWRRNDPEFTSRRVPVEVIRVAAEVVKTVLHTMVVVAWIVEDLGRNINGAERTQIRLISDVKEASESVVDGPTTEGSTKPLDIWTWAAISRATKIKTAESRRWKDITAASVNIVIGRIFQGWTETWLMCERLCERVADWSGLDCGTTFR